MALICKSSFPSRIPETFAPVAHLVAGGGDERQRRRLGAEAAEPRASESLRAIIIEDELFAAWLVEGLLEALGHEVVGIYSSGEEALAADLQHAQLAVVDINLGRGMDGIELATELRRRHSMPLVFCSAYSDDATRERIRQALPSASIVGKPVSERDLGGAIASATTAKH